MKSFKKLKLSGILCSVGVTLPHWIHGPRRDLGILHKPNTFRRKTWILLTSDISRGFLSYYGCTFKVLFKCPGTLCCVSKSWKFMARMPAQYWPSASHSYIVLLTWTAKRLTQKRRNLRKRLQNSNSEFKTITFNKVRSQMVHLISSRGGMYIYTADSTVFCIHPPPRLLTQLKYVLHMFSFSTQGSIAIVSMVFSVFGQIASNSH